MNYTRPDKHFQKSETFKRESGRWAWRVTPWHGKKIESGAEWINESDAREFLNRYLDLRRSKRKWK